jgi:hypothetical protein
MTDVTFRWPETVPQDQFSHQFIQGMLDRMALGFFKYGKHQDSVDAGVHFLESLDVRLDTYRESGNTEYLMDVANIAMIEFLHPQIPDAYFEPTDSDGSPGRVALKENVMGGTTRRVTQESNADLD